MAQREFPTQPLIGVGAVVVDPEGRVLLIKRGTEPGKGRWSIPGGLLELGESLVAGLRREVSEETGLQVEPEAIVEVVERIYTDREPKDNDSKDGRTKELDTSEHRVRYHYVIVDYWCRVLRGEVQPASDADEACWVTPNQWKDANLYALESITIDVIEKGWRMAQAKGIHG